MLSEKKIPKTFWPKTVNWTVHVLNRSPTLAVRNMTPEEAWSGFKPSVNYFRVFGCVSHVHIPDKKRIKLDEKSLKCVLLGVSEELNVYRLYDPVSRKIIVSRDVVFEEDRSWDWDEDYKEAITADLEWDESDEDNCIAESNNNIAELNDNERESEADLNVSKEEEMENDASDEPTEENSLAPNEG
ncbi:hypothetical protein EZV62_018856 [Acer yangbiense]|uniref:Retroviral polymerase SH3-like domain-containing protein n=1 Tax=Acer yangbiense TaxID=1000413 RepID=A0A5C7H977_9ROSI|nr:hypothetical protein EZV62_018856 [Acer yangbiense]